MNAYQDAIGIDVKSKMKLVSSIRKVCSIETIVYNSVYALCICIVSLVLVLMYNSVYAVQDYCEYIKSRRIYIEEIDIVLYITSFLDYIP